MLKVNIMACCCHTVQGVTRASTPTASTGAQYLWGSGSAQLAGSSAANSSSSSSSSRRRAIGSRGSGGAGLAAGAGGGCGVRQMMT
jgi:hypothetical protein